ncbi:MAG: class I SAM-dependent methyltransferase [Chloroflexi bacterium]|nr:class I SAM-dependent methyltransferase [Chloroflexota bacterium]
MNSEEYHLMYQIEDGYWWYKGMRQITFALLNGIASGRQERRVLDAGCGTGGNMVPLGRFGSVVGMDYAEEATRLSRQRERGAVLRGSIADLPFPQSTFDLVTCFDVLYHLAVVDDVAALGEMGRVLKPGGMLLVRVPAYDFLRGNHDVVVHTRHRYTLGELTAKVRQAGLQPIRATHANTVLFPLAGAKRLWESLPTSRSRAQSDLKPVPKLLNEALAGILGFEGWLIRRTSLPFGLSAICLAVKTA